MLNFLLTILSPEYNKVVLKDEFDKSLEEMKIKEKFSVKFLGEDVLLPFHFSRIENKTPATLAEKAKTSYFYHWLQE